MSSASSAPALHIALEPSRSLAAGLAAVHGTALMAALANGLPHLAKGFLLVLVAASFLKTWRDYRLEPKVTQVVRDGEGHWSIMTPTGPESATLADSSIATRWLVILHLKTESGRKAVLVPRDGTDPDSFRRLRIALRWRDQADP